MVPHKAYKKFRRESSGSKTELGWHTVVKTTKRKETNVLCENFIQKLLSHIERLKWKRRFWISLEENGKEQQERLSFVDLVFLVKCWSCFTDAAASVKHRKCLHACKHFALSYRSHKWTYRIFLIAAGRGFVLMMMKMRITSFAAKLGVDEKLIFTLVVSRQIISQSSVIGSMCCRMHYYACLCEKGSISDSEYRSYSLAGASEFSAVAICVSLEFCEHPFFSDLKKEKEQLSMLAIRLVFSVLSCELFVKC